MDASLNTPGAAPLPALIAALLEPGRYPDGVASVRLVETHISWVLLAGEFAYKIKKPVCMAFLDFSTLEQRKRCCEEELRLNRRFSPDLYLQVLPITGSVDDVQWAGAGEVIDYAVQMRRFDDSQCLDALCATGGLTPAHIADLAHTVVGFHGQAEVAAAGSTFGSPQAVLQPALDNFSLSAPLLQAADAPSQLAALRHWTVAQAQALTPLMLARKSRGLVRECHGDLHLGNLVLIDARVRLFDCIEFNAGLRWIDVASELAFTTMDLLHHEQPGLANLLVNEVLSAGADYACAPLLRFYAVYRAMVRAKVAALRSAQAGAADAACVDDALAYIALARRLAWPGTPRLTITHGLSGCGKTVASTRLLMQDPQGNTIRLRSDVERKRLYGLAPQQSSGSPMNQGIYAPQAHERTYAHLLEQARILLQAGWSVVVDAAFLRRCERDAFRALAQQQGTHFAIVAPQANLAQLQERIRDRQAIGADASEATLEVLEQQRRWVEPLAPDEAAWVDASGAPV